MTRFCLAALALMMIAMPAPTEARTVCTVVADAASAKVLIRRGDCRTRVMPASTFAYGNADVAGDPGKGSAPDRNRGYGWFVGRAETGGVRTRDAFLKEAPDLLDGVEPAAAEDKAQSWPEVKCARYRKAWSEALVRQGRQGLGQVFLERHEAFLASGCTERADVCPRSAEELNLANMMVVAAMNAGTASTFPPFACRKP